MLQQTHFLFIILQTEMNNELRGFFTSILVLKAIEYEKKCRTKETVFRWRWKEKKLEKCVNL